MPVCVGALLCVVKLKILVIDGEKTQTLESNKIAMRQLLIEAQLTEKMSQ